MNAVPSTDSAWGTSPFEAQYLKVYDVTTLAAPGSSPAVSAYALDGSVTFSWPAVVDSEGLAPRYRLTVTRSDSVVQSFETSATTYTVTGLPTGVTATGTVLTLNPNNTAVASTTTAPSSQTLSLTSAGDNDADGMINAAEIAAGTNPLDAGSIFKITSIKPAAGGGIIITWDAVAGKTYSIESKTNLNASTRTPVVSGLTLGTYTDTNPGAGNKFYRVKTGP